MSPFQIFSAIRIDELLIGLVEKSDDIQPLLQKGIIGPLNDSPKRLSYGVFPSARRSWMFGREQRHSKKSDHHLSSSPDCNNTADVPSFTRRTALSAMPFVSDR